MTQTLGRILRGRGDEGLDLPGVFPLLDRAGVKFRRGQVSLVVAAPGTGKSALATHMAVRMAYPDHGVPTLYWSADTDKTTLGARVLAGIKNRPTREIESLLEENDPTILEFADKATDHVWWCFEPGPSLTDIDEEIRAYAHVNGEYPHFIVLDNLMDIYGDSPDERESFNNSIGFLNEVARKYNAHVLLLHHAKGQYENGDTPIPFSGLLQNVGKKPRLVLTLFRPAPGVMGIRIVKNTMGQADASGEFGVDVAFLPERMWFG